MHYEVDDKDYVMISTLGSEVDIDDDGDNVVLVEEGSGD